jgi:hypothetical protein
LIGFILLISARHSLFPGILILLKNTIVVIFDFILNDCVLSILIVCIGIELIFHRNVKIPIIISGYLIACFGSIAAMIMNGSFGGRSCFITQVLLIIVLMMLIREIIPFILKRYIIYLSCLIAMIFIPSFYNGSKSIVRSSLLYMAREQYIIDQKSIGGMDVTVKSMIPVKDTVKDIHCGLYDGTDILNDPTDKEYLAHNSAIATFYGLNSLTGIPASGRTGLAKSLKEIIQLSKKTKLTKSKICKIIYKNWLLN